MNRGEFISRLRELLQDLSPAEREGGNSILQ